MESKPLDCESSRVESDCCAASPSGSAAFARVSTRRDATRCHWVCALSARRHPIASRRKRWRRRCDAMRCGVKRRGEERERGQQLQQQQQLLVSCRTLREARRSCVLYSTLLCNLLHTIACNRKPSNAIRCKCAVRWRTLASCCMRCEGWGPAAGRPDGWPAGGPADWRSGMR